MYAFKAPVRHHCALNDITTGTTLLWTTTHNAASETCRGHGLRCLLAIHNTASTLDAAPQRCDIAMHCAMHRIWTRPAAKAEERWHTLWTGHVPVPMSIAHSTCTPHTPVSRAPMPCLSGSWQWHWQVMPMASCFVSDLTSLAQLRTNRPVCASSASSARPAPPPSPSCYLYAICYMLCVYI
jgi:hypothetical protein